MIQNLFGSSNTIIDISIPYEREFWKNYILNIYVNPKERCPNCGLISLKINEYNSIYNPYVTRCSSSKCRKIVFLKENTFFALFPNTPVSLIINILRIWLLDDKNGAEIFKVIKDKYPHTSISHNHVLEILEKARYVIAHYIKDQYSLENISETGKNEYFAIDESNFINVENKQLWVVGIINTISKKIRLEIAFVRNTELMKNFIYNYIKPGNCIVSDQWGAYDWIDADNNYLHSVHNHGHGDFGTGYQSTSHIESVWGILKALLRIYITQFQAEILFYSFEKQNSGVQ